MNISKPWEKKGRATAAARAATMECAQDKKQAGVNLRKRAAKGSLKTNPSFLLVIGPEAHHLQSAMSSAIGPEAHHQVQCCSKIQADVK